MYTMEQKPLHSSNNIHLIDIYIYISVQNRNVKRPLPHYVQLANVADYNMAQALRIFPFRCYSSGINYC